MTMTSRSVSALVIASMLAGCSSLPSMPQMPRLPDMPQMANWTKDWRFCAGVGGLVGGAAGSARDRTVAVAGAVVGALIGVLICGKDNWNAQPTSTGPIPTEADSDNDGVPDRLDRCPNTPPGVKVDASGCSIGVAREATEDTRVVEVRPVQEAPAPAIVELRAAAAPLPDKPAERLAAADGTATPTAAPEPTPAPPPAQPAPATEPQSIKSEVHFANGTLELSPTAREVLNEVAKLMLADAKWMAEVSGHTDDAGAAPANRTLSQRRADAVKAYLVSRGVSPKAILARGYGQAAPVGDNQTPEGRSANRRVEIKLRIGASSTLPAAPAATLAQPLRRVAKHAPHGAASRQAAARAAHSAHSVRVSARRAVHLKASPVTHVKTGRPLHRKVALHAVHRRIATAKL